ncbi:MAG: dinitrogenase iron-molybdenum cofactor biosynthesis protein [Proteobacteria bacterium]|nr:dinitrogenase iron-molybdenum cofactor biosynthesis protein [Pseudomonadota bacterium]
MRKALITLDLDHVASRFDLTGEVWIGKVGPDSPPEGKTLVLSSASADELCKLVLTEKVNVVVTGAVENKYFEYLQWKNVTVYDSVIGHLDAVVEALDAGTLEPGTILDFEANH